MTDTKALTLAHQSSPEDSPEQVVEVYASHLMDELFDGVERALDGDVTALEKSPIFPAETPEDTELTLNFSEGGLPAVLLSETPASPPIHVPDSLTETAPTTDVPNASPQKPGWRRYLTVNRVLLGAAGLSLLATLGLWLHQRQQAPVAVTAPSPASAEAPVASANAEFLEYLRRSLDVITQQVGASATTPKAGVTDIPIALNNGTVGLPPIGNNALPLPSAAGLPPVNGSVQVIERVYIPYQAAQSPSPSVATVPSVSSGTVTPSPSAVPAPVHTLMGVLELGDRSAALFEIDGVSQRVYIGERIGNTDWSLVSVGNDEAVIRRNGEVRSIYIGQQF
ncbi:MAG: hypothetical protein F6K42_01425 [Leptolyngbya sp. SIO1D8]|nr:hypothetical protein [Leptolyngbya sp. SIO1D8]